jgi:hypothetical protein
VTQGVLAALVAALVWAGTPSAARAETCAPYEGGMTFPMIHGPEDPEDYCWEVQLGAGEKLRQIDDQHAEVDFESGHFAFGIQAKPAHDAVGTAVPTTLAVSDPNLITLTVHHRAGNPAAGGAPFDYPILSGTGWEGGFISEAVKGPADESEAKPKPTAPVEEIPALMCDVPALQGRTLQAARRALQRANCHLGPVRGQRRPGVKVVKQYRQYGETLPAGSVVGVKLG